MRILYAHPCSLGSGRKMWKKTHSSFTYIHTNIYFRLNFPLKEIFKNEYAVCSTHLPLLPPPPALLHQASRLPENESPPVSGVPAICSRTPGHQQGRRKRTWATVRKPQQVTGELHEPREPQINVRKISGSLHNRCKFDFSKMTAGDWSDTCSWMREQCNVTWQRHVNVIFYHLRVF